MSEKEQINEHLVKALTVAREQITEMDEIIKQLTGPALTYGVVLRTGNKMMFPKPVTLSDFTEDTKVKIKEERMKHYGLKFPNGKILEVEHETATVRFVEGAVLDVAVADLLLQDPEFEELETITLGAGGVREVFPPKDLNLEPGDIVTVNGFGNIAGRGTVTVFGSTATVKELMPDNYCKIELGGNIKTVFHAKLPDLEKGDIVLLDASDTIVIKNIKQDTQDFTVSSAINVEWSEIGGLDEIKEQMHEMVELPHSKPEVFKFYNKKPAKGVILYGPPGCGKTMVAKAIATSLAKMYGGNLTESGFIYIKGPEILNPYVGVTEQTIRQIFERARQHKEKSGFPATIFIDEVDAILSKRGTGVSSDMDKTIVPMFLTEMDGLVDSSAFIIMATNRVDTLDPAVMREGRVDLKVKVPRPSAAAARNIVKINLDKTKCQGDVNEIIDVIVETVFTTSLKKSVSGAMLAGIVDQAIGEAIRRDLKSKGKPTGVTALDAEAAVNKMSLRETEMPVQEIPE